MGAQWQWPAIAVCAVLLWACQHSNDGAKQPTPAPKLADSAVAPSSNGTDQHENYAPTKPFKAKQAELTLRLAEKLLIKCSATTGVSEMNACFHERALAGFDEDGVAKSHCPQRQDMDADFNCIVLGGMGYRLAAKVGKDVVSGFDWSDPRKSMREVTDQILLQQIRNCLANGSASDPMECVTSGLTKALELTSSDIEPCNQFVDDDIEFGKCIAEAYSYKYLSAGIGRM
jgi:hypothetical protein